MIQRIDIYNKIRDLYPDIGDLDNTVRIEYDPENHAWVVALKRDGTLLKTFLDDPDAETCVGQNQCIGLGIQIEMLKHNLSIL